MIRFIGKAVGAELESPYYGRGSNAGHQINQIRTKLKEKQEQGPVKKKPLTILNKAVTE